MDLRTALAAFDLWGSPAKVATGVKSRPAEISDHLLHISQERREEIEATAAELRDRGVAVCAISQPCYSPHLAEIPRAPGILFAWGNLDLLQAPSIGMCGSRNASEAGIEAARASGDEVASRGLTIVSGYAKGVDTETHLAALAANGTTIVVLAEGILHFRRKKVFEGTGFDERRVLVLSQFQPRQRWNVGNAMTRNGVIVGLGTALVVVEAGATGGTLDAGKRALGGRRPVLALQFNRTPTPPGNEELIAAGARPVATRRQLGRELDALGMTDRESYTQLPLS